MSINARTNIAIRKRSMIARIALMELATSAVLLLALLFVLPGALYSAVNRQAVKYADVICRQTLSEINSLLEELDKYGGYVNTSTELRKLIYTRGDPETALRLQNELTNMPIIDNYLTTAVMIIFNDADDVVCSYGVTEADIGEASAEWFGKYRKYGGKNMLHLSYDEAGATEKLYYAIRIEDFIGEKVDIVLVCSLSPFIQYLNLLNASNYDYALLEGNSGCIYSSGAGADWIDGAVPSAPRPVGRDAVYEYDRGIGIAYNTSFNGWTLIINISKATLLAPYRSAISAMTVVILLFFAVLQIWVVVMLSGMLKPVRSLARLMRTAARGDLSVRAVIRTGDEMEVLGDCFNQMTALLDENIRRLIEQEKVEQQMKYSLLISQIDPHFIYNTLNGITYLARCGRNADIAIINKKLMEILQDRLRISGIEFFDTLERERDVINSYIVIQKYRYGDNFEVKWELPEKMLETQIPKNVLQPIVENALFHGLLSNKDEDGSIIGGLITISAYAEGGYLTLRVSDNGRGMDASKAALFNSGASEKQRGRHIGLANIRERLQYLYKNDFGISVESSAGNGTSVYIRIREQAG